MKSGVCRGHPPSSLGIGRATTFMCEKTPASARLAWPGNITFVKRTDLLKHNTMETGLLVPQNGVQKRKRE